MVTKLMAEIMREKLRNREKVLKFQCHLIGVLEEENASQNKLKVKMKKTPKDEERQFSEWREHQVQFRMNEKEYPCLDTSLMKFHNQGLRENPKNLREKTGYLCRQTTENKHIKIKYPPKERENPFVAIWRI